MKHWLKGQTLDKKKLDKDFFSKSRMMLAGFGICVAVFMIAPSPIQGHSGHPTKPTTHAQVAPDSTLSYDIEAAIHEDLLNKYFAAIGPISGSNEVDAIVYKGAFDWTVHKITTHIDPEKTRVKADVHIKLGAIETSSIAEGYLNVRYDNDNHTILFDVSNFVFDISVTVFGNRVTLMTLDISDYVSPKFAIDAPIPSSIESSIVLPDGKQVKVTTVPSDVHIYTREKAFVLRSTFSIQSLFI